MRACWLAVAVCALVACSSDARSSNARSADEDAFPRIFKALRPSVVLFTMRAPSEDPKRKGAFDDAYGSGFVVESGAWGSRVLTAEHVIENARRLCVVLGNQRKLAAHLVVADVKEDVAIVAVDAPNLPVVRLGASALLEPGIQIGVAGYPIPDAFADEGLGMATSVFSGRLSSVRKDTLELDIPVIPGESGGPVFDAHTGVVIGIAESRFEDERSIGFAIPIEDAERLLAAHPRKGAIGR